MEFFFIINDELLHFWASLMAQTVKNLPAMPETRIPLEEEMLTHTNILPEKSRNRGAWWATAKKDCKELDTTEQLSTHSTICLLLWDISQESRMVQGKLFSFSIPLVRFIYMNVG